jgi:hypothetical protein
MQLPKNSLISVFATSIVYKLSLIFIDLHMHDPITVATRSKSTRTPAVEAQGDLPGVYRQLYWHCSESSWLRLVALLWAWAWEADSIYRCTRNGAVQSGRTFRPRSRWTKSKKTILHSVFYRLNSSSGMEPWNLIKHLRKSCPEAIQFSLPSQTVSVSSSLIPIMSSVMHYFSNILPFMSRYMKFFNEGFGTN